MKVKYIGESFYDGNGLTNNKIYDCVAIYKDEECLGIIDDSEEDYLYSTKKPSAGDDKQLFGKWEIIEDKDGKLKEEFKRLNLI